MTEQNITPAEHLAQVIAMFDADANPRLAEIMASAVKHLHAFVEEVKLTRDEWFAGIQYLTAVGHKSDDKRQEFILLSDTLGVSMLVEMVNQQPAEGATEPTVLGPFYVPGAPARAFGDSIVDDDSVGGEPLVLRGTVRDLDGSPIAGATLDIWQVQPNGLYDIQETERDSNLRGVFTTDDEGRYEFRTVRPIDYTIPDDGPVGSMLKATGRHPWRPAHIHIMAAAPDRKPLVTHVFDAASPWLKSDAVFGVRESLAVPMEGGECSFDVVLERT
ncbi:MAG: dioxygenase family protein [Acidimicrobiia bacterium]